MLDLGTVQGCLKTVHYQRIVQIVDLVVQKIVHYQRMPQIVDLVGQKIVHYQRIVQIVDLVGQKIVHYQEIVQEIVQKLGQDIVLLFVQVQAGQDIVQADLDIDLKIALDCQEIGQG